MTHRNTIDVTNMHGRKSGIRRTTYETVRHRLDALSVPVRLIATAAIIVGSACSTTTSTRSGAASNAAPTTEAADLLHPKTFVHVDEVTRQGRRIPILRAEDEHPMTEVLERVHHEVDRDSRIEVRFDRDRLAKQNRPTRVQVMVTGRVEGEANRAIEIRNYSRVGEQSTPTAVTVRSGSEIRSMLYGLLASSRNIQTQLDELGRLGQARSQEDIQNTADSLDQLHLERARLEAERMNILGETDQFQLDSREPATEDYPSAPRADGSVAPVGLPELVGRRSRVEADLNANAVAISTARRDLTLLRSEQSNRRAARPFVPVRRAELLERRSTIEAPLRELTLPANRVLLEVIANAGQSNAEQVTRLASLITDVWLAELERSHRASSTSDSDTLRLDRDTRILENINAAVFEISQIFERAVREPSVAGSLASYVKDTDLFVAETGATPGERIVLAVQNGHGAPELQRDLELRLRVRELGWVRRLDESVLLVRRIDVHGDKNEDELLRRIELVGAAHRNGETLTRADTVYRRQSPITYDPAPSLNLGWTFNERYCANPSEGYQRTRGGCFIKNVMWWLQPSLNLNVALVPFGSETVVLRRVVGGDGDSNAPDPGSEPTATVEIVETVSERRRGLDAGLGFTLGLFDNTVMVGMGRHLTASEHREYFALGFSFVRVIEGVVQMRQAR